MMQVSGHMYPVEDSGGNQSLLLPFTTSWGRATWQRAWRQFDGQASGAARLQASFRERYRFDIDGSYPYYAMLCQQLAGNSDSWAIRWYLSVFQADGRVLFPPRTLVDNTGFDGSGTHCETRQHGAAQQFALPAAISVEAASDEDHAAVLAEIKRQLRGTRGLTRRLGDWGRRLVA